MGILISLGAVSPVIAVQKQPIDRVISLNHFKQAASYHLDKTSIGGINVDMKPAQIIKILGKPKKISEKIGCTVDYTLIYDGMKIVISDFVSTINTTNSNYRTDLGIKIGDPISKAEKMYDRKLGFKSEKQTGLVTYRERIERNPEMSLVLEIGHKNGRITYIKYERSVHQSC
jgi:hypothetical protein